MANPYEVSGVAACPVGACGAAVGEPCKDVLPGTVHAQRVFAARLLINSTYGKGGEGGSVPAPGRYRCAYADMSRDRLEEYTAQLEMQLTATQARCTELLEEVRDLRARNVKKLEHIERLEAGIVLPGWRCPCGCFNGAVKVLHLTCRACDKLRPR